MQLPRQGQPDALLVMQLPRLSSGWGSSKQSTCLAIFSEPQEGVRRRAVRHHEGVRAEGELVRHEIEPKCFVPVRVCVVGENPCRATRDKRPRGSRGVWSGAPAERK